MQREKLPFIPELLAPLHADKIVWRRLRPRRGEIGLAGGVCLNFDAFPAPALATAYADFQAFLSAAGIPAFQHAGATRVEGGQFAVRLQSGAVSGRESYRIAVDDAGCVITAEECEGVRRALILLEDEIVIDVNLNSGTYGKTAYGCDLTYDYVKINGDYRT